MLVATALLMLAAGLAPAGAQGSSASAQGSAAAAANPASLVLDLQGHSGPIRRIAVDAQGRHAVTASDDKTAIVWSLADARLRHVLRVPVGQGEIGRLYGAAITPAGDLVAVAGATAAPGGVHRIHIFDIATGAFVRAFDARGGDVRRLAWSPDGRFLAAVFVREPALRVFGADGALWHEDRLPADSYGVSISAQGQIAVASFDRKIRLYREQNRRVQPIGEIRTTLNDPVSVRHSPDGRSLAVGYFSFEQDTGERGTIRRRRIVDVYDAAERELRRRIEIDGVPEGNLMSVAWQHDGAALYAGGTGYARDGEYAIKRIAWPQGDVTTIVAATDSIQDLAPLPTGGMAFASYDGSWGVIEGNAVTRRSEATTLRVVDAEQLRVSADARRVQWRRDATAAAQAFNFALDRRSATEVASAELRAPVALDRQAFSVLGARGFAPSVNGERVAMLPNEISRGVALFPDRASLVMAASRTLRRIGRDGRELWNLPLHTEARAANVSEDGRLIVAALGDGSIRWYRAADGAPLLSLLVLRDKRWIVWTESGHYDASPGAEDLVGWLVTRPGGERADFHGASRFRERFLRPDVIDQVLAQADVARATTVANAARLDEARASAQDDLVARVEARQQPVAPTQALPSALSLAKPTGGDIAGDTLDVELAVYSAAGAAPQLEARVDGRPVPIEVKRVEPRPNGETFAQVTIQLVSAAGLVHISDKGTNGHSMPLAIDYRSSSPVLRAQAPGALYVLAIGVSRYANPVINLLQASKDARDFAAKMKSQEGELYPRVHTRVVTDEAATQAAVLDALKWLSTTPQSNDTAVLFVAGHGVVDAADTYYFLPHDMREARLARTAISETQLRDALAAVKGRALFFVDTCFASRAIGTFERRETNRMASGLSQAELGVIVFSGSAPKQESLETTAWGNGAFTKALVEGLGGQADPKRRGFVTHVGLDGYVSEAVRTLTRGRQTPVTAVPQGIADYTVARWAAAAAASGAVESKP